MQFAKNKCNRCKMDSSACSCLSIEVEEFKEEIKTNYFNLAGSNASQIGLANDIWTKLYYTAKQLERAQKSEAKAWEEKRQSLASAAKNHVAKYEPIIEQQNVLIKKLQMMIEKKEPKTIENTPTKAKGCPGCGSTTRCYCT